MRILLDENVPIDILPILKEAGHDAQSVNFIGLKGLHNGDLISHSSSGSIWLDAHARQGLHFRLSNRLYYGDVCVVLLRDSATAWTGLRELVRRHLAGRREFARWKSHPAWLSDVSYVAKYILPRPRNRRRRAAANYVNLAN
jgi:hypothetical protein